MEEKSYLTKEIIKKLNEKVPEKGSNYSVCTCGQITIVDFETTCSMMLLLSEEELEKNRHKSGKWDKYYIETEFCPSCRNDSSKVRIKEIPIEN